MWNRPQSKMLSDHRTPCLSLMSRRCGVNILPCGPVDLCVNPFCHFWNMSGPSRGTTGLLAFESAATMFELCARSSSCCCQAYDCCFEFTSCASRCIAASKPNASTRDNQHGRRYVQNFQEPSSYLGAVSLLIFSLCYQSWTRSQFASAKGVRVTEPLNRSIRLFPV